MSFPFQCLLMGAAGRDFHDLQTFFRRNPQFQVRAFTASQIPFISSRAVPRELAGPPYSEDIPIFDESLLPELIARLGIDFVFLCYSDLSHADVMHKASLVQAAGASFVLLGPAQTQLVARKPVISVTAVRTGAGKSPITQFLARALQATGRKVAVIRHPMPYGDLRSQRVQRFDGPDDFNRHQCTIEEREEYEPYVEQGTPLFAGVDYAQILELAEAEADVILWDGGNNDFSFLKPNLSIVVADALRAGHEVGYFPGETNLRSADVIVINKVDQARAEDILTIRQNISAVNRRAGILEGALEITVDHPERILGRTALVIEDGPTLTHGGMSFGAGKLAAEKFGAAAILDPRPYAVGTLADAFRLHTHIGPVLPALGYSEAQREELRQTIAACPADVLIDASPAQVERVIQLEVPVARVSYRFVQRNGTPLEKLAEQVLSRL